MKNNLHVMVAEMFTLGLAAFLHSTECQRHAVATVYSLLALS